MPSPGLGPEHAALNGLRAAASETQLTRVLASTFAAEPMMASGFVRAVCRKAPNATRLDLDGFPSELECLAEQTLEEGRADLSFVDHSRTWHVVVELKIHAGYGHKQLERYLGSFHVGTKRQVLAAVTRDVPTYGDLDIEDERWAGSVQWARLLPELRRLQPTNAELARQWPLLLDVLESEGSMGFTQADPDLFNTWASYYQARHHVVDFMNHLREPLLEALREARAPELPADQRGHLAAFVKPGKNKIVVVRPRLGKVPVRFRVPADGPERLSAAAWGWGEPRFAIELPFPKTVDPGSRAAVERLLGAGFENRQNRDQVLWRHVRLDAALLASDELEDRVLAFARESFGMVVASGVLDVEPGNAASLEGPSDVE